jgi:hypothetical protein
LKALSDTFQATGTPVQVLQWYFKFISYLNSFMFFFVIIIIILFLLLFYFYYFNSWLSVIRTEKCENQVGSFNISDFDVKSAYLATSPKGFIISFSRHIVILFILILIDVIELFGEEIILLWNALVLKKRVVVICEKLTVLLKIIR